MVRYDAGKRKKAGKIYNDEKRKRERKKSLFRKPSDFLKANILHSIFVVAIT